MRRVWASCVVALAVAAVVLSVPELRQQARGGETAQVIYRALSFGQPGRWRRDVLETFRAQAAAFVESDCPEDPEMLMAAGLLTPDVGRALPLLSRAAQLKQDPVLYAAYVRRLLERSPKYARLGAAVVDPADREEVGQAQASPSNVPDRLSAEAMAPILDALRGWEKVDPENGLPHALEAYYLYGLHRDQEAQRAWARAGQLPHAWEYAWAMVLARGRLLNRMGMVKADATLLTSTGQSHWWFETLRPMVRYAWYEGRVAQVAGRSEDAMRWWSNTISLGRRLQDSADTKGGFMYGSLLEHAGAAPTWQVGYDGEGRKLFYGPAHAFYAAQIAPEADAELRDRLLVAWERVGLLQQTPGPGPYEPDSPIARATGLQGMAGVALALAAWCLAIFALVSLVARRAPEAGTRPGWAWPVLTGVMAAALALTGPAWALLHPEPIVLAAGRAQARPPDLPPGVLLAEASFIAALLLVLGVPLLVSLRRQDGQQSLDAAAWGGNLRRALPVVIAVLALAYLGLNLGAAKLRADWLRVWTKPGATNLSVQISRIGPQWDRPESPKRGWVAAEPPQNALARGSQWPWP